MAYRCRECGYHETAEQSCRQDASLSECIACQLPCPNAGNDSDMEDCRAADATPCADCAASACSYQGQRVDDEEPAEAAAEGEVAA